MVKHFKASPVSAHSSLHPAPLPLVRWVIVAKLVECTWLVYLNCRQSKTVMQTERLADNLNTLYSQSDLLKSKASAIKRIQCDVIIAMLDTVVIIVAAMRRRLFDLWLACESVDEGNELSTSLIFTMMIVTLYWIARCIPVSFMHRFFVMKEPIQIQSIFIWWLDSIYNYVSLLNDYLTITVVLTLSRPYWGETELGLPLTVAIYYGVAHVYWLLATDQGSSLAAYWAMPNSKLKLRLSVVSSLLGFRPQNIFNIDRWLDESRPKLECDLIKDNQMTSLILTYYREEAGGGHAKSFDVPEIMSFAAHGLAMSKYMYPFVMTIMTTGKAVVKLMISHRLLTSGLIGVGFGLPDKSPNLIGLFISYFIVLSSFTTVWRYIELWLSRRFYEMSDRVVISLGLGRNLAKTILKMDAKGGIPPMADGLYAAQYSVRPASQCRWVSLNAPP